jgi:uncharacterized protein YkwD
MKKNLLIKIALVYFVVFLSTAFAATDSHNNFTESKNPQQILTLINQYRADHGLSPLRLGKYLSEVAESHSRNIAENKIPFGHQGFDKRTEEIFSEYKYQKPQSIAENVAMNSQGGDAKIVEQWLASVGHRKNIEGDYNWTGIGKIVDRNGSVYVTQIFLRLKER